MRLKIITLVIGISVLLGAGTFAAMKESLPVETLQRVNIGDGIFTLRVAQTDAARERGLGGVPALARDAGMLFIFPKDDFHAIWMKDMLIPIDIMWLSAGLEVIDAKENVSPDTFPVIFTPKVPARFVVELSAGSLKAFGARVGSRAKFFAE